jgi:hypothetical protein
MRRLWWLGFIAVTGVAWCTGALSQDAVKTLGRVQSNVAPARAAEAPAAPAESPAASSITPATPIPEDNLLVEGEALYRHQAERDPFTPLVRGGGLQGPEVKVRPGTTGLARFTVEACTMEAVLKTQAGTVAWFQGPDSKPYKAVVGERFADGVVLEISYDSGEVTIQQELNDPTAIKPFRNLVLRIRSLEGEGQ